MQRGISWAVALAVCGAAACGDNPKYDVRVKLPGTDAGAAVDSQLADGTASLKLFPCDVSVRLGQCVAGMPIQLVMVPSGAANSGSTNCNPKSARSILQDHVGERITLGRGDAGVLWIQAFQGDDDDDSGLVERREMHAYGEFRSGFLEVTAFDGTTLEATVEAEDDPGTGVLSGTLGAVDGDNTAAFAVGPRCTWPIGAKAN
ncbi:MAG: hypothetical protein HY904_11825 [Deltaproteobacteria bacterium]|nr:hypothetical protein [Deltaproteobacteria bacterium]